MEPSLIRLPSEILFTILSELDICHLKQLSLTNTHLNRVCKDESLWKFVFNKLTSNPFRITTDTCAQQLGSTWFERVVFFWQLTHPQKVYTLIVFEDDSEIENEDSFEDIDWPCTILGQFEVETFDLARTCIVQSFLDKVEPIYSTFNSLITRFLEREGRDFKEDPDFIAKL